MKGKLLEPDSLQFFLTSHRNINHYRQNPNNNLMKRVKSMFPVVCIRNPLLKQFVLFIVSFTMSKLSIEHHPEYFSICQKFVRPLHSNPTEAFT